MPNILKPSSAPTTGTANGTAVKIQSPKVTQPTTSKAPIHQGNRPNPVPPPAHPAGEGLYGEAAPHLSPAQKHNGSWSNAGGHVSASETDAVS